jgi:signal peptidase I
MMPEPQIFDDSHALKCELAGEVLRSSGTLRLQVTGWSMLPSVWPGDTLVVERANSNAVSEGDIVLFGRDRRLFAHRVVAKRSQPEESFVVTRGDAMPATDSPVSDDELLGRVCFIVRDGRLIEPSRSLGFSERAVAALVRSSEVGARMVVGVHGMRHASQNLASYA